MYMFYLVSIHLHSMIGTYEWKSDLNVLSIIFCLISRKIRSNCC